MIVAGVDEAGRGPLAGPVTVSAVILNEVIKGLDDSKRLSEKKRLSLVGEIKSKALAWSVVHVSVEEIDQINILQATLLGMQLAVKELTIQPQKVLVDGNKTPDLEMPVDAIVGGDAKVASISAASILAKSARDELMVQMDLEYPGYGFAQHKGYGTKLHLEALQSLGPCIQHRKSFTPVKNLLQVEWP